MSRITTHCRPMHSLPFDFLPGSDRERVGASVTPQVTCRLFLSIQIMKFKTHCGTFLCVASLVLAPSMSAAQFGAIGNLLGGKSSGAASGGGDITGSQDALARNYVAAGQQIMKANGHFANALGIQAQALNANATSDSLSAKDIEAQDKAISADAAAISEAIKAGATLKDAESKVKYSQGLAALVSGIIKYKDMSRSAQTFASDLSSASPLMIPKLQSGMHIVKTLPSNVSNLSSSLKSAMDFAKSNGVEIPADATGLL